MAHQIIGQGPNVNVSKLHDNQEEAAGAIDPHEPIRVVAQQAPISPGVLGLLNGEPGFLQPLQAPDHFLDGSETTFLDLPNLAATEAFGRRLGQLLFPGAVVALLGPLGAGKTHLVRAIAEGLGVPDPRLVTSPTFVLLQEYHGRLPIFHFDAYRLSSSESFDDLGAQEVFEGDGVCLVEWADRVAASLPSEYLRVQLIVVSETARRAELKGIGARYEMLVQRVSGG